MADFPSSPSAKFTYPSPTRPRPCTSPGPTRSDHRKDHVAPSNSRVDVFSEVDAERNVIDIHEDGVVAEVSADDRRSAQ